MNQFNINQWMCTCGQINNIGNPKCSQCNTVYYLNQPIYQHDDLPAGVDIEVKTELQLIKEQLDRIEKMLTSSNDCKISPEDKEKWLRYLKFLGY